MRPEANTRTSRERCATAGGARRVEDETVGQRFSPPIDRSHCPRVGAAHLIRPPKRHICLCCRPPAARQRRGVDEAFLVVTLPTLEVVDLSMASPAPVEAPVQRGEFR